MMDEALIGLLQPAFLSGVTCLHTLEALMITVPLYVIQNKSILKRKIKFYFFKITQKLTCMLQIKIASFSIAKFWIGSAKVT